MLRFAVVSASGLRAASWKVWADRKGEIYLACREQSGTLKVSLHRSGRWQVALTREFFAREEPAFLPGRFLETWQRPEPVAPGFTLALRIITPWFSVRVPRDHRDRHVIPIQASGEGVAVESYVVLQASGSSVGAEGWPGKSAMGTSLVGSVRTVHGEVVWVVARPVPFTHAGPLKGTVHYFRGKTAADIRNAQRVRALAFGSEPDGSRVIYDLSVNATLHD